MRSSHGTPIAQDFLLAWLLFSLTLVLYLVTRSVNPMFDGLIYCGQVVTGDPRLFLMGQHVLYGPVAYVFSGMATWLAPGLSTWDGMRLLSSVSGATAVALLFSTCRVLGLSKQIAMGAALLMGLSLEFWNHAVNVEYVMPNNAVLAAFLWAGVSHALKPRHHGPLVVGTLWGLAMLAHLSHVLLILPGLVFLSAGGGRFRSIVRGGCAAGFVFIGGYVLFGWLRFDQVRLPEILDWALRDTTVGESPVMTPLWSFRLTNFLLAPLWQVGAMVHPSHLHHLLWGHPRLNGLGPIAATIVVVLVIIGAAGALKATLRDGSRQRRVLVALAVWVGAYSFFFSFWCPSEEVWWVSNLIPLCVAIAIGLGSLCNTRRRFTGTALLVCTIVPMAVLNLTDRHGILHNMRTRDHQIGHLARLSKDARPGDVVLWVGYLDKWEWGAHLRDVAPGVSDRGIGFFLSHSFTTADRVGTLEILNRERTVRFIIETRISIGRTIWVSLSRCTPEETVQWAESWHRPSARAIARLLAEYALVPTDDECLWKLARLPESSTDIEPPAQERNGTSHHATRTEGSLATIAG